MLYRIVTVETSMWDAALKHEMIKQHVPWNAV